MLSLQQRLMRQTGITATDIVTIAGENPWRSTASVYESKLASRAQIEKEAAEESKGPNDRMLNGQVFEAALAERYCIDLPAPVSVYLAPEVTYRAADCEWAIATPDRFVYIGERDTMNRRLSAGEPADWLLECKLVGNRIVKGWNIDEAASDVDADRIPPYVYTQVQWQMRVLDYDRCDVAALFYGSTLRRFTVARDDDYIAALHDIAEDFWFNNVCKRVPPEPDGSWEYARFLDRLHPRQNDALVDAPEGAEALAQRYEDLRTAEKEAKLEKQRIGQVLQTMVGANLGICGSWGYVKAFDRRGRVDMEALVKGLGLSQSVVEQYRSAPERQLYVKTSFKKEGKL